MNRVTPSIILVSLFSLVLSACGSSPSTVPNPASPTTNIPLPTSSLPAPTQTFAQPAPTRVPPGETIVVDNVDDSGPGTLRQALTAAQPGDIINFDSQVFPHDNPTTISLMGTLPPLSQGNITIDASNAGVVLDGSNIANADSAYGFHILSDNNIIRGMQIIGFPEAGIALEGNSSYNIIGGDRGIGDSQLGQGNLINGNARFGVALWETSHNTVIGNYIGVSLDSLSTQGNASDGIHSSGATHNLIIDNVVAGNGTGIYLCCVADGHNTITANIVGIETNNETNVGDRFGILVDQTENNTIGPDNQIAFNGEGITYWAETTANTITQNSIHDNSRLGIHVNVVSDARRISPLILEYDLQAGSVTGLACLNCIVEIFSGEDEEGATFEGQTKVDGTGLFSYSQASAFSGSRLSAVSTDPHGSTSEFSRSTQAESGILAFQEGNQLPKLRLQTRQSKDLADNRIGSNHGRLWTFQDEDKQILLEDLTAMGVKRFVAVFHEREFPIDWGFGSEYVIPETADRLIDELGENGIAVNYAIHFWDKDSLSEGEETVGPRFQTQDEIDKFLDYVRFLVGHLKGRVDYYTIWTEPEICRDTAVKCVNPVDYVNLASQAIPVIREEDPDAKIILAPVVLRFGRHWLFPVLDSEVVALFDVIDWHPFYDIAPDNEFEQFFYNYPLIIQDLKQRASENGFQGEYWGTDLTWAPVVDPNRPSDEPSSGHTEIQNAKYYARITVLQLGMDVGVGVEGLHRDRRIPFETMANLSTVMAGASSGSLPVEIESDATDILSYGFLLPNGDSLFALWTNGIALDNDSGINGTLSFPGLSATSILAIDVLHGYEQELIFEIESGKLIIRNLSVKDYPIFLRISE